MTITVLTAAYGGDLLQAQREQECGEDIRWLAVVDYPEAKTGDVLEGWELKVEPRPHLSPRMAAKIPKYLPGHYVPEQNALTVWMDCSVQLTSPHAISRFTDFMDFGIGLIPHPDRRTVAAEWPEAAAQGRYRGQMVKEQYEFYRDHPADWVDNRLYATTIIVQRVHEHHHIWGMRWLVENCVWSAQDQISLPWVTANTGLWITPINLDLWHNDYFMLRQREVDV